MIWPDTNFCVRRGFQDKPNAKDLDIIVQSVTCEVMDY